MQGYRLYAISCYTGVDWEKSKLKLFEAYERGKNMGGDEAFVGLVSYVKDPEKLHQRVTQDWNNNQIGIFSCATGDLRAALVKWFTEGLTTKRGIP